MAITKSERLCESYFLPFEFELDGFKVMGVSRAGIGTSIFFPNLSAVFDVANGYKPAYTAKHIFITHGHMDHASGLPYLISLRTLNDLDPATAYMPPSMVEPMTGIMKLWAQIENFEYDVTFEAVGESRHFEISKTFSVRPFSTVHRIQSFGYLIEQKKKTLRPEYFHFSETQLKDLAQQGIAISQVVEIPWLVFTGDTQIDVLDRHPWLCNVQNLMIEVTYFDEKKSVAEARKWGHVHFDEILERLPGLTCERLIMVHPSRRHQRGDIERVLNSRLPTEWKSKTYVFGMGDH